MINQRTPLLEFRPKLSLGFSFYVFIQNQPSVSLRVIITLLYIVYRSTQSHKLYSFSVVLHQGVPSFVHREQKVNIKLWCSHLNNNLCILALIFFLLFL